MIFYNPFLRELPNRISFESLFLFEGLTTRYLFTFFRQDGKKRGDVVRTLCLVVFLVFGGTLAFSPSAVFAEEVKVKIRLFGTVEFKGTLKSFKVWQDLLQRNARSPLFLAGTKLNTSTTWDDLKAKLEPLPLREQIKQVNLFWNKWPYREDPEIYRKPDYWACPSEFRKNSGDCEDYAIAKYFTLRALGVPAEQMRVVVLMETIRNIAHAVLVVYDGDDAFVLDNLSNNVLSHSRYKNYLPQFSVNEEFRWAHVRPKK